MRLVVAGLMVLCCTFTACTGYRFTSWFFASPPAPVLWSTYNLTGSFPITCDIRYPGPAAWIHRFSADSMLWSYLYDEDLPECRTLCIIGTGDIMLGTNYPSESYLPPGEDCSPLLRPVHHVLQSGDLLFGNLEGGFCSEGGTPKKCKDTTNCYVFRMPDHFAVLPGGGGI